MKKVFPLLILFIFSFCCFGIAAQENSIDEKRLEELIEGLHNPKLFKRLALIQELQEKKDGETAGLLIEVLKTETDYDEQAYAALALGGFGALAEEAVPELIATFPVIDFTTNDNLFVQIAEKKFKKILGPGYRSYVNVHSTIVDKDSPVLEQPLPGQSKVGFDFEGNYRLIVHSGAYALSKITGEKLGYDVGTWQQWWDENKDRYE